MLEIYLVASGIIASESFSNSYEVNPSEIEYVIACDEEAVGDRYQRGGGNRQSYSRPCRMFNASIDTKFFAVHLPMPLLLRLALCRRYLKMLQ